MDGLWPGWKAAEGEFELNEVGTSTLAGGGGDRDEDADVGRSNDVVALGGDGPGDYEGERGAGCQSASRLTGEGVTGASRAE